MSHALRTRFWIETILGSITGTLDIITLLWHDWIETVVGVDPDKGNGSAESLVVTILLVVTLTFALGARLEWRRARPAHR